MALQSSGPISLSDIATEQGISQSNISLRSVSNTAGFAAPDAITEFYGYSAATGNSQYLDFSVGDALRKTAFTSPFQLSGSQDLTVSMWIKKGSTTANEIFFDMSATASNTANRFFLQYHYSLNRIVARHRTSSTNYDRQWAVHDNNSSIGCGTNSGTKWSSSNRGNVNGDDWSMLTIVYDASQSNSTNGLKLYWNATEVTSTAASASGTRSTANVMDITLGNNNHNPTTTSGGFSGGMDEVKIFGAALSAANISTLYNSGVMDNADHTYNTNLLTEFTFESGTSDSDGLFPTVQTSTATLTSH